MSAIRLAELGMAVVVAGRTREPLEETADIIRDRGGQSLVCQADVSVESDAYHLAKSAQDAFGRIDALVLSAAVGLYGPSAEYSLADWETTMAINLRGPFLCARAVYPYFERQRAGKIVAIASGAARQGYPGLAAYSASKFGLLGLMQSLGAEWLNDGIQVSTILPGSIRTGFAGRSIDQYDELVASGKAFLEPDDVARAVVYLIESPPGAWTQELNVWPVRSPDSR